MSPSTVSFDVFDTLLTRIWAEPRDLFARLGEILISTGSSKLDPLSFASERVDSEARARSRIPSREVTLDLIYEELGERMKWTQAERSRAMAAEIDLESEGIRVVARASARLEDARSKAGRIIFLSDMYLPSALIRRWLESANLCREGDLVLVSGEAGAGKGTGALFRNAAEVTSGKFNEWTHVGDNRVSDFDVPGNLGINSIVDQSVHLLPRERMLRGEAQIADPWRSRLAGAARLARMGIPRDLLTERDQVLWSIGTSVSGPLFWAYTDWCLREAEKRGIEDLYFLSRGGQIFFRIANAIQARRTVRLRLHYLYSSRLAFSGIADAHDRNFLHKLVSAPLPFHSFQQALTNAGIQDATDLSPPGINRDEWGRNLTRDEREAVANYLLSPAILPRIRSALEERGRLGGAFLKQIGLTSCSRIGLVDTGWMGTIQRNVEFLIKAGGGKTTVTGFYIGLSTMRDISCAGEMLAYSNIFAPLPLRRETTHLIMLELMASGTHGPLLRFAESGGKIVPVLGSASEESIADARLFQEAAVEFVNRIYDTKQPVDFPEREIAQAVIGAYREFFRRPSLQEALAFGRTPHSNQMLEESYTQLCPEMTTQQVLKAMLSFRQRPPGWWLYGQAKQGQSLLIYAYLAAKRIKWWVQTGITGQSN